MRVNRGVGNTVHCIYTLAIHCITLAIHCIPLEHLTTLSLVSEGQFVPLPIVLYKHKYNVSCSFVKSLLLIHFLCNGRQALKEMFQMEDMFNDMHYV